jgi:hypothetical protein
LRGPTTLIVQFLLIIEERLHKKVSIEIILTPNILIISIKVSSFLSSPIVILAGDAGVGKSNFLLRYVKGIYDNVPSTIGVEFAYKVHYLKNQTKVKAQIWDTCKNEIFDTTAGSEKYRSITTGHYRFALGAVLVYDITNRESF